MSTHLLPERLSFLNPHILDDLARYGNSQDGGYVLPRSIAANIDAVLSCGLSTDWSLEKELAAGNSERVIHVYDHTVSARSFRRSLKNAFWKFVVGRTSLADLRRRYRTVTDYNEFFTGNHVHFRERIFNRQDHANDATLATAFARLHAASRILVKIDIEGDEYRVIPELARFADRIDLVAIEFHNTEPFREVFEAQIHTLLQHFAIVHLHGNNIAGAAVDGLPDALEITFVNRRFALSDRRRNRLPVTGLDFPNDPNRPELAVVFL